MHHRTGLLVGLAALFLSVSAQGQEPRLLSASREIREMNEAILSPDGTKVATVIMGSAAEAAQTHIWVSPVDGSQTRQLTFSTSSVADGGERAPKWSPDGRLLYFLAKRSDDRGLYRLPMIGGEAVGLTIARPASGAVISGWDAKSDDAVNTQVKAYAVSVDGRSIAVIAEDGETEDRTAQVKKKDDAVQVGRDDVKKTRLYLADADTGVAREIPLPDNVEYAHWNAASDALIVVTAPEDDDLGPANRIWTVTPNTAQATPLNKLPTSAARPLWTAKGLVYQARCEVDSPPDCLDVYTYDLASGSSRNLTRGLKGSLVENYVVEKGGMNVVTPIQVGVQQKVARINLDSGVVSWLDFPQPVVFAVDTNASQSGWVFLAGGPTQAKVAFFSAALGAPPTRLGAPALTPAGWPATPSGLISWKNGALSLDGLLYVPATMPGKSIALVVVVHGGPTGLFQDRQNNLANLLVAQGWAVFLPNPRGSLGYGVPFLAANKNDLGGGDYGDIMAGVDEVLRRHANIDASRMALIGYSYGGEMAAFVEGRTNRFKALVSGAPVIDQFSEYGTEDSSFYDRWYFGKPWDRFADAWRQSPLARVGQAKTPMLLLQGDDDPTDPPGQSKEMYRALTQVGVPVTLVTYPRETHKTLSRTFAGDPTSEPWHGVDLRRRLIGFLQDAFTAAAKPGGK